MPSYAQTLASPHLAPPPDTLHQGLERQGWPIPKSALIAMARPGAPNGVQRIHIKWIVNT